MKTRSIAALIVGLVAVLALGGSPAGAGTAVGPEITDQAGDANFINGQGSIGGFPTQTTPAAIDAADITGIWFETGYSTVKETDAVGNVTAVRYVPNALLVKIRTVAPPRPSFGPALIYRVPATIAGCEVWFQGWVGGPASTPLDLDRADVRKITSTCPGGAATITSGAFSISSAGNDLILKYPFSALPIPTGAAQIYLAKDVELRPPPTAPGVRTVIASAVTAPQIDDTRVLATKFRLGSDVPPDVDCTVTPAPAECTA